MLILVLELIKRARRQIFLRFPNNRIIAILLNYRFFGLNEIDGKLRKFLPIKNGFFVELGANDGLKQSNTKYFELFRGWSGILIEPEPKNYNLLQHNRSENSKSFNAACVSFDFPEAEIAMIYSDLMTSPLEGRNGLPNARAHAKLGEEFWGGESYEFLAPARTLNSILKEAHAPSNIQLLSLDVEGAELEVLLGLNFSQYSFDYLLIESRDILSLEKLLGHNGYFVIDKLSVHDYLFSKNAIPQR
jgi:FkbM family methyltransferase